MDVQEKIDAYVKNQLAEEERQAFEQELQQSADLRAAVEQARLDLDVGNRLVELDLRARMQKWREEESGGGHQQNKNNSRQWYWISGIALLVLVIGAVYLLTLPEPPALPAPPQPSPAPADTTQVADPPSPKPSDDVPVARNAPRSADRQLIALAEISYKYNEGPTITREGPNEKGPETIIEKSIQALADEDYTTAITLLSTVPQESSDYLSAQPLLAEAYFSQGAYFKAEEVLEPLLPLYADLVEWNLLMAYLAQGPDREEQVDTLLSKILNDRDHPDYDRAVQLKAQFEAQN